MISTILGSKGKMGQTFVEGFRIPVTKIMAGPCVVTQIKNLDTDGYWAVQLGFGERRIKNTTKPMQGHLRQALAGRDHEGGPRHLLPRFLREIRFEEDPGLNVGDIIKASDIFKVGDIVAVAGISKGKGFAGVVRRWHFEGGPHTHGQSDRERAPGSIGATTTPGRVLKGKKMAGRMGSEKKTVKNLHIILIDPEKGEISVSGSVPGISNGLLRIKKIKAGSLEELEHETVAQIVEGEAPTEEAKEATTEGGTPNA